MPSLKALLLAVLPALACPALAAPQSHDSYALVPVERAMPDAPDGYAPKKTDCPSSRPTIRSAAKLAQGEQDFLKKRRSQTIQAMRNLLKRNSIRGFDVNSYISNHSSNDSLLPNIAVAASGGGYRAMLTGAGALKAFDNRTSGATGKGQLGGLLQSSTYVAGLSGGSWMVGSIFMNNFTTVEKLQSGDLDVWDLSRSIMKGPKDGPIGIWDTTKYWDRLTDEVKAKREAGYDTSLTDYWGRALSYQFVRGKDGAVSYTWSSTQDEPGLKNGDWPMPIVVADSRNPGESVPLGNSTIFEFTPWELGTHDPTVYGFVPLRYVGTRFMSGSVPDNETCYRGIDNVGYVMGTSATLFNAAISNTDEVTTSETYQKLLKGILEPLDKSDNDIAPYNPNPFYGYQNSTNPFAKTDQLSLVDGGEDGQNIPLQPLIQPERAVDVVFAVDASADTDSYWPNGTSLVATYERAKEYKIANGTDFPAVPDANTFVNNGLNNKPTFFGCDAKNTTGRTPIIVYLPNSPYSYQANVSTYKMSYDDKERDAIIENSYNMATRGNATLDKEWPTCVSCVILSRSFDRTNTTVPAACKTCFDRYCWDGKTNSTEPSEYEPKMVEPKKSSAIKRVAPVVLATIPTITMAFAL